MGLVGTELISTAEGKNAALDQRNHPCILAEAGHQKRPGGVANPQQDEDRNARELGAGDCTRDIGKEHQIEGTERTRKARTTTLR